MLRIDNLHVYYGGIHALKGISLEVPEGRIVTLIGANGAGKSTILRTISGLVEKNKGTIIYNDNDISLFDTRERVMDGLILVPEGRRTFHNLSVYENLQLGYYMREDYDGIKLDLEWVYELFPILKERNQQKAGTLSGGEQQMLAVGRALMSRPRVLLMDEPSLGLAPILVKNIFEIIEKINKQGTTILLIEQNAYAALNIADYAYVMETGDIIMEGPGSELMNKEEVKKAYLGA